MPLLLKFNDLNSVEPERRPARKIGDMNCFYAVSQENGEIMG